MRKKEKMKKKNSREGGRGKKSGLKFSLHWERAQKKKGGGKKKKKKKTQTCPSSFLPGKSRRGRGEKKSKKGRKKGMGRGGGRKRGEVFYLSNFPISNLKREETAV